MENLTSKVTPASEQFIQKFYCYNANDVFSLGFNFQTIMLKEKKDCRIHENVLCRWLYHKKISNFQWQAPKDEIWIKNQKKTIGILRSETREQEKEKVQKNLTHSSGESKSVIHFEYHKCVPLKEFLVNCFQWPL